MPKRTTTDTYHSPPPKRSKPSTSSSTTTGTSTKKVKPTIKTAKAAQEDQPPYWALNPPTSTRRVTLSSFKGKTMVDIREFYAGGEGGALLLPGKKGISLTTEQFGALVSALPEIEGELKGMGVVLGRPEYGGSRGGGKVDGDEAEEEDDDGGDGVDEDVDDDDDDEEEDEEEKDKKAAELKGKANRPKASTTKKNFEATSDEEDER